MRLNVGCGKDIREGFINIDAMKAPGVDKVHDLNRYPYPFRKASVDYIFCSHVLEHLEDPEKALYEFHRIMKKGAKLEIIVPHFTNKGAYVPHHRTFYHSDALKLWVAGGKQKGLSDKLFIQRYRRVRFFKGLNLHNYLVEPLANAFLAFWENSFLRALFPASEVRFILEKI
jgi:SAM-dependent methyltransferase